MGTIYIQFIPHRPTTDVESYIHAMKSSIIPLSLVLSAVALPLLHADEVTETIEEATAYYADENYSEAASSLNYAVQLINQKASEQLGQFLPEAPDGWEKGEPEYQSAGASLFGGGNTASARYSNGNATLTVTIAANSPALQSMMMFVNNPAFLGASGKKIERIGGQKALVEWSDNYGNINVIVAGTALLTVEGSETTLEAATALAEAVNYKKLVAQLMQ